MREESKVNREVREKRYLQETKERRVIVEAEADELVPKRAVSLKDHVDTFTDKLIAFGER